MKKRPLISSSEYVIIKYRTPHLSSSRWNTELNNNQLSICLLYLLRQADCRASYQMLRCICGLMVNHCISVGEEKHKKH